MPLTPSKSDGSGVDVDVVLDEWTRPVAWTASVRDLCERVRKAASDTAIYSACREKA